MPKTPTNIPVTTETKAGQVRWYSPATLREEMDRLFDDFFTGWPMTSIRRRRVDTDPWRRFQGMFEATFPVADVVEGEGDYRVTAELPGMTEKDIEISLAGDTLTVRGENKEEREEKAENRYVAERRFGSFQRSFQLPEDADPEKIEAGIQQRRPDRDPAEAAGGAGQTPQDRGQGGLTVRVSLGRQQARWRPLAIGISSAVRQGASGQQ